MSNMWYTQTNTEDAFHNYGGIGCLFASLFSRDTIVSVTYLHLPTLHLYLLHVLDQTSVFWWFELLLFKRAHLQFVQLIFHYFRRYLEISELGKNKPHQREQLCAIRRNYAQTSAISKSVIFSFYNCEEVIGGLFVASILGQLKTNIFSSNEHIYSFSIVYLHLCSNGWWRNNIMGLPSIRNGFGQYLVIIVDLYVVSPQKLEVRKIRT